jgi:hypothetical protein
MKYTKEESEVFYGRQPKSPKFFDCVSKIIITKNTLPEIIIALSEQNLNCTTIYKEQNNV